MASPTGKRWNIFRSTQAPDQHRLYGTLVWGKAAASPIVVEGAWDAMVSKDGFKEVQMILRSTRFQEVPGGSFPQVDEQVLAQRISQLRQVQTSLFRETGRIGPFQLLRV